MHKLCPEIVSPLFILHQGVIMKRIVIAMLSVTALNAYADGVIWPVNPSGRQPMVNAPPLTLLTVPGDSPVQTTTGDKCLLVSRRGSAIVAVELDPLKIGPKIIGWKPKEISADELTKDWDYKAQPLVQDQKKFEPKRVEGQLFDNPITSEYIMSNKSLGNGYNNVASSSSSWSNASVDAHGKASVETESTAVVTINGKTYRKYTHFKDATQDMPTPASDEYFCK
jgi:hypothetical protein